MSNSININTGLPIFRKVINISEIDVQTMVQYPLLSTNGNSFIVLYCYFRVYNQTISYINFNEIQLTSSSGNICGIYEEATATGGGIDMVRNFGFSMNVNSIGNGGNYKLLGDVYIGWLNIPSQGNGNMKVTIYYTTDI